MESIKRSILANPYITVVEPRESPLLDQSTIGTNQITLVFRPLDHRDTSSLMDMCCRKLLQMASLEELKEELMPYLYEKCLDNQPLIFGYYDTNYDDSDYE